ncbi:MAG: hydroxymethylbilane synthase [Gemmatimonadota bacterium]
MTGTGGLRLGTRGSALALAQTQLVAAALAARGVEVEIVTIKTTGDTAARDASWPLARGAFVTELERALAADAIDLAVHSAKDLPTDASPGVEIVAYPVRADPRDALVSRSGAALEALPEGARVGTESPRRRAFLLHRRGDLEIVPIHGNVDSRLRQLDAGACDALVLAAAGLDRLGLADRIVERLAPAVMLSAVGQGALAIQLRAGDPRREVVGALDHAPTRAAVEAERAFLRGMGGGCRAPFAALATVEGPSLGLDAAALEPDGGELIRERLVGTIAEPAALGDRAAERLLSRGAGRLASEVRA